MNEREVEKGQLNLPMRPDERCTCSGWRVEKPGVVCGSGVTAIRIRALEARRIYLQRVGSLWLREWGCMLVGERDGSRDDQEPVLER